VDNLQTIQKRMKQPMKNPPKWKTKELQELAETSEHLGWMKISPKGTPKRFIWHFYKKRNTIIVAMRWYEPGKKEKIITWEQFWEIYTKSKDIKAKNESYVINEEIAEKIEMALVTREI
jgi:hypothetical protein